MINPKIEPIKIFFMLSKPKIKVNDSLNQEKNVIKATDNITPGNAYPEIEIKLNNSKILLLFTLFPKFMIKDKIINTMLATTTKSKVFKFNVIISISLKYFGNLKVQ